VDVRLDISSGSEIREGRRDRSIQQWLSTTAIARKVVQIVVVRGLARGVMQAQIGSTIHVYHTPDSWCKTRWGSSCLSASTSNTGSGTGCPIST
jgi:hypothetical protein